MTFTSTISSRKCWEVTVAMPKLTGYGCPECGHWHRRLRAPRLETTDEVQVRCENCGNVEIIGREVNVGGVTA